jgi:hypothetical protein
MTIFHKITKSEKLVILLIIPTYAKVSSQKKLNKAQALGLLELNDKHIQPSEKGFNFLNDLQIIFL